MGLTVEGIVLNKLTINEILDLPNSLNKLKSEVNTKWNWQNDMTEEFLIDYWNRDSDYYKNNLKNPEIWKMAIIWGGYLDIHFFHKNIVTIGVDINWNSFLEYKDVREKVKTIIIPIMKELKAEEIIYTYELSTQMHEDEFNKRNFNSLQQVKELLLANNYRVIE